MPRRTAASPEDFEIARRLWCAGASWGEASRAIEGRAAATTIRRRAMQGGWVRDDGAPTRPSLEQRKAQTAAANAAYLRKWSDEKDRLISRLIGLADELIDEVTAPHEVVEVKVVPQGKENGSEVETVRTRLTSPVPADKQRLVTSTAILIDKILLASGEATTRNESLTQRGELAQRAKVLRDELAERRAAAAEPTGATG